MTQVLARPSDATAATMVAPRRGTTAAGAARLPAARLVLRGARRAPLDLAVDPRRCSRSRSRPAAATCSTTRSRASIDKNRPVAVADVGQLDQRTPR